MKALYLRIWLTVVAALALFALVSGWMWQQHMDAERARLEAAARDRLSAWAEMVQRALPSADAPLAEQADALREWSQRLQVPLALDDRRGLRIAESDAFSRRRGPPPVAILLDDGRTLWMSRRDARRPPPGEVVTEQTITVTRNDGSTITLRSQRGPLLGDQPPGPVLGDRPPPPAGPLSMLVGAPGAFGLPSTFGLPNALGPLVLVALLFVAVALGAYPVVRRLTRRLEALKAGVQAFGAGNLAQRVPVDGRDEVAAVAQTFNQAAERVQDLVRSHQSMLANASHELRSPLARLKMAVAMYGDMPPERRDALRREIDTNVAELDALVEEVLLASRLEGGARMDLSEPVDLLGIAVEEAARVDAEVESDGDPAALVRPGNDRLLRRALRNLLENARRYAVAAPAPAALPAAGTEPPPANGLLVQVQALPGGGAELRVCDRGPGVPAELRERIFEPYFRLPGHAEREGGVGLGLSLVRQIAGAHGGSVHCEARPGGGSCFVIRLPAAAPGG